MDKIDLFDGHCDTISSCYATGGGLRQRAGHLDLTRGREYGRYGQFFALFADGAEAHALPMDAQFEAQYALFLRETAANSDLITFCRTGAEAERAFGAGKSAAFLSVEGGELLGCSLERLEQAYRLGVRAVNPTWNHQNPLCGTTVEETERGLSAQGRSFVLKMEALGMLVDVSHLSDRGFWDVAELLHGPFIASHSNSRATFFAPRNLTDGQFTAIIEHGGVAGLNLYADFLGAAATVDTVVAHLEHFLALGGEKAVALGADFDGCSRLTEGVAGVEDMDKLWERLLQRNYSEALLRDLFFENLMRVVNNVCTM